MTSKELIEQTKKLIAIPSTADNPAALKEAIDYVAAIVAKQKGVTIEWFESKGKHSFLAYRGDTRPEKFDILLNGHVDVVPADPELFTPVEKNGKLYGRGALDMKGTTLVLTDVFCELVNEVPYNLGLQIVTDEEIGGYDGVKVQINNGVRANFIIMGEYANDQGVIYNAARGLCWAEIAFNGKSAHGGHLWHGTNAIVKAGDFAGAVLKRYPTPDKETWTTTASIANLSTPNDTFNKVPDQAVLKIDFRFTQEDPVFKDRDSIEAFIHSIDPDAKLVNLAVFEPAVNVEELNPYVQGMNAAMKEVTGKKARFLGRPAASDGRHYALVRNDIVEFGLYGKGSHSNEEYVELDSFAEYQSILRAFLRQPIPARLKKQEVVPLHEKLLSKLVEMPTTTGDLGAINNALQYVENFLKSRGMYVERFERNGIGSVLASTRPGNKKPKVLLNAHIDTVPGSENMYKLTLKKDRFVGRGVMDMKHAIAAYLALVDDLKDELDAYDFGIMINSDEEVGGNNGVKPLVQQEGYRPDVVIIPDGGNNWELERFSKGVYWIELSAAGKRAHASRPWEGDSAIHRLLGALKEVEKLVKANPKPEDTLLSVGTIKGGTTANQIPAEASAMLDIRTGSVEDHERLPGEIEAICKRHGVNMTIVSNEGPTVTDPKNPYVKQMVEIAEELTGEKHETSFDYAVTDGRFFYAAGVPTIVINPECGDIHGDNEWLSRSGFTKFCQAIEMYVRRVAAVKPVPAPRSSKISRLAKRLNSDSSPVYVWYANYGGGLPYKGFMKYIRGGTPEGAAVKYKPCRDTSPPLEDHFISLPYGMYFAGESEAWPGGGVGMLNTSPDGRTQTIARIYLITIEQLEDITAQHNMVEGSVRLPVTKAIRQGYAKIGVDAKDLYDILLYCGERDGYPIFALTGNRHHLPYTPPSPGYTRSVLKGLSEGSDIEKEAAKKFVADSTKNNAAA